MDWWAPGATAVVVHVPEAEEVVGPLRRVHSPSGRDGMSAHVTLLAPLVDWPRIADEYLRDLAAAAIAFPRFPFRLSRPGRFPSALYLEPDPAQPFVALAHALRRVVPAEPPPGGTMTPHLTIASRVEDDAMLAELEEHVRPLLPIETTANEVAIYERGEDLKLRVREKLELGP